MPGSGKEPMTNDISGPSSEKQFATYDPDTHSWRMFPDTGLWGSIEYSQTWPKTGCMFDGRAYELPTSVPPTIESVCSSWLPTPTVGNATGTNERRGGARSEEKLLPGVVLDFLPAPTASDSDKARDNPAQARRKSPPISAVSVHFPTPRTTDANGAGRHGTGGPDLRTAIQELSGAPTLPLFDVGNA
jgi:hypothetical protein